MTSVAPPTDLALERVWLVERATGEVRDVSIAEYLRIHNADRTYAICSSYRVAFIRAERIRHQLAVRS